MTSSRYKSNFHTTGALFAFAFFSLHSFCFAQEEKDPSGFFSEGFVTQGEQVKDGESYFKEPEEIEDIPPEADPQFEAIANETAPAKEIEPQPSSPQRSAVDRIREQNSNGESLQERLSVVERLKSSLSKGNDIGEQKPTVRLFVSGYPTSHLAPYVQQLAKLKRVYKIDVAGVYVVLESLKVNFLRQSGLFDPLAIPALEELNSGGVAIQPVKGIPSRFTFKHSPTWIVTINGEDHVFEGYRNPSAFFPRTGEFDPSKISWK